ncbi:MAG TPA: SUMF1/EgtB/PvdO family nonheme iron enzyme [Candidatus Cybelea sp.]
MLLLFAVLLCAQTPEPPSYERAPGVVFDDCESCPEMVVIKAGKFTMGSTPAQKTWAVAHGASAEAVADEAPQHIVSIHSFALGEYDITRAQYAAFVEETGYQAMGGCARNGSAAGVAPNLTWDNPGFTQTDSDPVVCVSWQDAQAFVRWTNQRVSGSAGSGPYRLPTEAEWEYSARGGTTTRFWWGDDATVAVARAWFEVNSGGRTQPTASKSSNDFGLFEIVGNVWQWTQDCYEASYVVAPGNGSDVENSNACQRVDRGGSWFSPLWELRPTTRDHDAANFRASTNGFRLARDL